MQRSRLAEATLVGCLTALASFCALNARGDETYSIVAQSTRASAATGRAPISERIAAANLPIIAPDADRPIPPDPTPEPEPVEASGQAPGQVSPSPTAWSSRAEPAVAAANAENMAVPAVPVDHEHAEMPPPGPRVVVKPKGSWPFDGSLTPRWPTSLSPASFSTTITNSLTGRPSAVAAAPTTPPGRRPAAQTQGQRQGADRSAATMARQGGRDGRPQSPQRQVSASASGKGLSGSSPASVTR